MTSNYISFHDYMMEYTKEQLFVYSFILRADCVKQSDKKAVIVDKLSDYIQSNARSILDGLPLYEIQRMQKMLNSSKGRIPVNPLNHGKDILSIIELSTFEENVEKDITYSMIYPEFRAAFTAALVGYVDEEVNQKRFKMEQSLIGLLNIYGALEMEEIMDLYLELYPDTDNEDLIEQLIASYLFPISTEEFGEQKSRKVYVSPLMKDAAYVSELMDAIAYPRLHKGFTKEVVEKAGEMPFPIFETEMLVPVREWFKKYKLLPERSKELTSYFWMYTNERSDLLPVLFTLFDHIGVTSKQADTAMAMFNNYFNSAPSWVLRGASENHFIAEFGSDALIREHEERINAQFNDEEYDPSDIEEAENDMDANYLTHNTDRLGMSLPIPHFPKVGRNDPCPCGSGRKFKVCCGNN